MYESDTPGFGTPGCVLFGELLLMASPGITQQ